MTGMATEKEEVCLVRRIATAAFLMIFFASPFSAWAGDADSNATRSVAAEEIVVTGARTEQTLRETPVSMSVVHDEALRRAPAQTIADALADVPGVEVYDQSVAGAKRVLIRGESGARVLVLIDGQKISEQKSMSGPALLIDPSRVERIEVVKGPASVLYGSEAIGGVVNVITKKGGEELVQGEMSLTFDSSTDGFKQYLSLFGGHKDLSYRVSGSYADHGDRHGAEEVVDSSSFMTRDVSAFLGYDNGKFAAGATYDNYWSDINSHAPEDMGPPITYFHLDLPEWSREKGAAYAEVRNLASFFTKARLDAYYQNTHKEFHNDMDMTVAMGPGMSMDMRKRIKTENDMDTFGGSLQTDWLPHCDHFLIVGYDYGNDSLDAAQESVTTTISPMPPPSGSVTTETDIYEYEGVVETHAVYAQDEWMITDELVLTAGGRYTYVDSELSSSNNPAVSENSVSDSHPVFSAGLTYRAIESLTLRGLFSQGYRFPSLQQLYIGTVHGGAEPTYPNPDLDAEKSNNFEAGARYFGEVFGNRLTLDVAGFMSLAEDYITTTSAPGGRQFANVDEAETRGVEVLAAYTLSNSRITPYASGLWFRRHYDAGAFSTWDTGHPEYSGKAGVKYEKDNQFPGVLFHYNIFMRAAGEAKEEFSDGTLETYEEWRTLNLLAGISFGDKREYFVNLAFNNILNEDYQTAASSLDEPGTHAVVTVGASF